MKIVTGYTGTKHITAADDAGLMQGIIGTDSYVLSVGSELKATVASSTKIRIADGELVMQGRHARIESGYDTLDIADGTQGQRRNDLIVARYMIDAATRVESIALVVIKGTSGSSAIDPAHTTGDIDNGEMKDFPLYRVKLNGLNIESVEPLFTVLTPMIEHVAALTNHESKLSNLESDFGGHDNEIRVLQGDVANQSEVINAFKNTFSFNEDAASTTNVLKMAKVVGARPALLWSNPSPTASFAAQTVALDKPYPLYLVKFKVTKGMTRFFTQIVADGDYSAAEWMEGVHIPGGFSYHGRKYRINAGNAAFESATTKTADNLTVLGATGDVLIPIAIYGIETM